MSMLLAVASSLMIVASNATCADNGWRSVIEALKAKHSDAKVEVASVASVTNSLGEIRRFRPRYLAFVMRPDELDEPTVRVLHKIVREVDDDPYDDAIWGIVTGPTVASAKRVATSKGPVEFRSALSTTGLGMDIVPGRVTMLSDGNPPGYWKVKGLDGIVSEYHTDDNDITAPFVLGWNDDPDLVLTSSHATERNLEMPFSRGQVVSTSNGYFVASCGLPMSEPKREKVWIAAGNCLIANPKPTKFKLQSPTASMVMTAIGWGKVNQFFGYTVETWFGEIGWNTWRYFGAYRMPLNLSWYAANLNLVRTIEMSEAGSMERRGKEWDMDGTILYGDPMQEMGLPPLKEEIKWDENALPRLVVFPDSCRPAERKWEHPSSWDVLVADDFALITKW